MKRLWRKRGPIDPGAEYIERLNQEAKARDEGPRPPTPSSFEHPSPVMLKLPFAMSQGQAEAAKQRFLEIMRNQKSHQTEDN